MSQPLVILCLYVDNWSRAWGDAMEWQERLNAAVNRRGWTVYAFAQRLAETGRKSSSYGSVWAYLNKADSAAPPLVFFEGAAAILGVRPAWLAFGDGEATEAEERERVRAEHEPQMERERSARAGALGAAREELGSLSPVGVEGFDQMVLAAVTVAGQWRALREEDPDPQTRFIEAARALTRASRLPVDALGMDPAGWPETAKAQYLAAVIPALTPLLDLECSRSLVGRREEQPLTKNGDEHGEA
jgi:hypothetical protein